VRVLEGHINKKLKDIPAKDAAKIIWNELLNKSEFADEIVKKIFDYFSSFGSTDTMYLNGLSRISEHLQEDSYEDLRNIVRVLEERNKFCSMLKERLKECSEKRKKALEKKSEHIIEVTIGSENHMKEFKNFSVVSSSYCLKDRTVGLVGILGGKRMEYPKMISIVDAVSCAVEDILSEWETFSDTE
jgi:heat-inducible transcriptional repressor